MSHRPKILWVEDSARYELAELLGPVFFEHKYLLDLAEDASTAMHQLTMQCYDALIVDIRLPPGNEPVWQELYKDAGRDKIKAQLGLRLLDWLLRPDGATRKYVTTRPPAVCPEQIAIFTVESWDQVKGELTDLHICTYEQKTTSIPDTVLLDLIQELEKCQKDGNHRPM